MNNLYHVLVMHRVDGNAFFEHYGPNRDTAIGKKRPLQVDLFLNFHLAAYLQLPGNERDIANKAYKLTNHIGSPWHENKGVDCNIRGGTRSTSVGDIILISQHDITRENFTLHCYEVASLGFNYVGQLVDIFTDNLERLKRIG